MDIRGGVNLSGVNIIDKYRVPNAPTIGTASYTSGTTATVSFTAPSFDGNQPITSYTAVSNPGGITGTINQSGSGTITVTGLGGGVSYTFTVYATNIVGNSESSAASNQITIDAPVGQISYTTAGTYSWVVPANTTSISILTVGGGQGGATAPSAIQGGKGGNGGQLAYLNNYSVTPGQTYTIVVGAGGAGGVGGPVGGNSNVALSGTTVIGARGGGEQAGSPFGSYTDYGNGGTGGTGDQGTPYPGGGGGGAGGYGGTTSSGGGGGGMFVGRNGTFVAAYGGGGGGSQSTGGVNSIGGGGGGAVGILGMVANSSANAVASINSVGGYGGSGGANGTGSSTRNGGAGASPGGGGGGAGYSGSSGTAASGGAGAVRIIWPGAARYFPSTRTANE